MKKPASELYLCPPSRPLLLAALTGTMADLPPFSGIPQLSGDDLGDSFGVMLISTIIVAA